MGRADEAIAVTKRTLELDPLSPQSAVTVAVSYYFARQYDRALEQAQRAVKLDPTLFKRTGGSGWRTRRRTSFSKRVTSSNSRYNFPRSTSHISQTPRGSTLGRARRLKPDRLSPGERIVQDSIYFSMANWTHLSYVALGDKAEVFVWMDRAYAERDGWLLTLRVNPWFEPLRSDPRFDELVRRVEAAAKLTRTSKHPSGK
jgi:tetratricopeptide (TPR) repeat protein